MSLTLRRLYYLTAIVVFIVVGPLMVAWTGGYRWTGWPSGFTRTSSLAVFSTPKAELVLNGKSLGLTPVRLSHLAPGRYTIELRQTGYGSWRHEIRLLSSVAQTIGPVQLVASDFTSQPVDTGDSTLVTSGPSLDTIVSAKPVAGQWLARRVWPKPMTSATVLPWAPLFVQTSPAGVISLYQGAKQTAIVTTAPPITWLTDRLSDPQWVAGTDTILYGLQAGHVVRLDTLQQQAAEFGLATSFRLATGTIWMTQTTASETTVLKQRAFGQQVPDVVMRLPGAWWLTSSPADTLLIKEQASGNLTELIVNAISGQVSTRSFGPVDGWWWFKTSEPPVWQRGAELLTLDGQGHEQLIDRTSVGISQAAWFIPGHILLTFDGQQLVLRGVSDRQGHGVILARQFTPPASLLGLDLADRQAVIQTSSTPLLLSAWSW